MAENDKKPSDIDSRSNEPLQKDEKVTGSENEADSHEVVSTRTAKVWLDADGIIHKEFHEHAEETLKDALESMEVIKRISKGRKLPIMIDMGKVHSMDPEARAYYSGNEAFSATSAAAAVTKSLMSRLIGNFFLGFNKPEYPRKVFSNESEALDWLKDFLSSQHKQHKE